MNSESPYTKMHCSCLHIANDEWLELSFFVKISIYKDGDTKWRMVVVLLHVITYFNNFKLFLLK